MSGKTWARVGFATGIAASISANVAHSFLLPTPAAGSIIAAAFWPVALLISIEVITRVNWPSGWHWQLVRYGGLTTVAAIAAVISYRHMAALLAAYNEDPLSAAIGPLAVDGLMVVCSGALLAIAYNARSAAALPEGTDIDVGTNGVRGNSADLEQPEQETSNNTGNPGNGLRLAARRAYLHSVKADKPLTGKQLGEQFQRGERWGRNIITEARREP